MKVFAYLPTPGGLTGAPRRLLTLASVLRDEGIDMCIATRPDSELFMAAQQLGLETVAVEPAGVLRERHGALFGGNTVFRLKALFSLLVQNLTIARKIREQGADVVWIRSSKGIAFAGPGALLSRRALVWDVDYEWPSRGAVRWLHRLGLWAAQRVVFQYSAAPDKIFGPALAARYRTKFQTIIPGIDLPALARFRAERMARRRRESDPFVILQVGTVCGRKNQELLVDALARLRQIYPNAPIRVQLAGGVFEEDYAETLKGKINAGGLTGVVEFLGWRSDIHELMAAADVLVMPSRDEGVPNTIQEAMAIGLPVIVGKAGGMPEVVLHGETGWVLPLDEAEAWANQINACVSDRTLREKVSNAAVEYAMNHFGAEQWGRQYANTIKGVVQN